MTLLIVQLITGTIIRHIHEPWGGGELALNLLAQERVFLNLQVKKNGLTWSPPAPVVMEPRIKKSWKYWNKEINREIEVKGTLPTHPRIIFVFLLLKYFLLSLPPPPFLKRCFVPVYILYTHEHDINTETITVNRFLLDIMSNLS